MPRREDIETILILGAGPIVIGQACEFDYSGTQACKALKEEGYKVILVNSNPATIMTDPGFADRPYIDPLTPAQNVQLRQAIRDYRSTRVSAPCTRRTSTPRGRRTRASAIWRTRR